MRRSFQTTSGNVASVASASTAAGDDGDGTAVHSSELWGGRNGDRTRAPLLPPSHGAAAKRRAASVAGRSTVEARRTNIVVRVLVSGFWKPSPGVAVPMASKPRASSTWSMFRRAGATTLLQSTGT